MRLKDTFDIWHMGLCLYTLAKSNIYICFFFFLSQSCFYALGTPGVFKGPVSSVVVHWTANRMVPGLIPAATGHTLSLKLDGCLILSSLKCALKLFAMLVPLCDISFI